MRKFVISMLLASAIATPALAGPRADRQAAREQAQAERSNAREERAATRAEKPAARADRSQVQNDRTQAREDRVQLGEQRQVEIQSNRAARDSQVERVQRPDRQVIEQRVDRRAADRTIDRTIDRTVERSVNSSAADRVARQTARDDRKVSREAQLAQSRERLQEIREARRDAGPPPVSRTPREGTQPPPPPTTTRPTPAPQWSTGWRRNHHYDWSDYRHRHSSLFNLGFYYDPFGWGYYPYSIGWRMWPSYYGSSFWINDPWQYRLPYAPPGTRWIRYYNDVVLVDMWSGQVLDVIYDFFW